jgi:hypothetical protein
MNLVKAVLVGLAFVGSLLLLGMLVTFLTILWALLPWIVGFAFVATVAYACMTEDEG